MSILAVKRMGMVKGKMRKRMCPTGIFQHPCYQEVNLEEGDCNEFNCDNRSKMK